MRYRWKLLLVLLAIALLPIGVMRSFAVRSARFFADRTISQMRTDLIEGAESRIRLLTGGYTETLAARRMAVESMVHRQVFEVERILSEPPAEGPRLYRVEDFDDGRPLPPDTAASPQHYRPNPQGGLMMFQVSYDHLVFHTAPGVFWEDVREDAARLSRLARFFEQTPAEVQDRVLWQFVTLSNGLHASHPAHGGIPPGLDPRLQDWYREPPMTFDNPWSRVYVDPATRQTVFAASGPVHRPDGSFAGVTGVVAPVDLALSSEFLHKNVPPETELLLAVLAEEEGPGDAEIYVAARPRQTGPRHRSWRTLLKPEQLTSPDRTQFREMVRDFAEGRQGSQRMSYQGRDSLWLYGPVQQEALEFKGFILLITPYSSILEPARRAEKSVEGMIADLMRLSRYALAGTLILVVVLAFSFARTVTKPIEALVDRARRLAEGDFESRLHVRSRDEIGDLARMFNQVGPRLKEHYRMTQALGLAMEVQQHFLPDAPPAVPGLDAAGRSVYCDETGGDYYDYIPGLADDGLWVVVADASDHGVQAALLMASVRAYLRQRLAMPGDPAAAAAEVNRQLCRDVQDTGGFMTMLCCRFDGAGREVAWVRAGHEPGLLYDPEKDDFEELAGPGPALGLDEDANYTTGRRRLVPGQVLLLGTDGVWEVHDDAGRMLGREAVKAVIREHSAGSAEDMVQAVMDRIFAFRGPADKTPVQDDITLVVVKVLPDKEA